MKSWTITLYLAISLFLRTSHVYASVESDNLIPCTCGVFMSGQFVKGSSEQPKGYPVITQDLEDKFPCSVIGNNQCINKCLDMIIRHLPNGHHVICGSIDRDCHRERAYLFIKNCKNKWINTNLSAGREYCCKDGIPLKCPII